MFGRMVSPRRVPGELCLPSPPKKLSLTVSLYQFVYPMLLLGVRRVLRMRLRHMPRFSRLLLNSSSPDVPIWSMESIGKSFHGSSLYLRPRPLAVYSIYCHAGNGRRSQEEMGGRQVSRSGQFSSFEQHCKVDGGPLIWRLG